MRKPFLALVQFFRLFAPRPTREAMLNVVADHGRKGRDYQGRNELRKEVLDTRNGSNGRARSSESNAFADMFHGPSGTMLSVFTSSI